MKHLYQLAFILVIGASFALAQAGSGSQTMPSTPSSPSGAQQTPDQSATGQSGTASAASATKAQSDIQSALRKQLPASADSVTVSVTDDNKIQLSGSVNSESEKQQVEQIARSASPNVEIVNKLNVSGSGSSTTPGSMPPSSTQPPSGSKPPLELVAYRQQSGSGSQTSPSGSQSPSGSTPDTQTSPSGANNPTQTSPSSTGSQSGSSAGSQSGSTDNSQTSANSGDVQDKIQKAIQQDSSLSGANVNVSVMGNKVELNGTVASKDQKKMAKQIAESNAGGMKVVDHLKVSKNENGNSPSSTNPPKQ